MGLNDAFLNNDVPKTLLLAGPERMDKDLTVAHMQGKFRMMCSKTPVGHHVHEDDPVGTAKYLKDFLVLFRCALGREELEKKKKDKVG